jgi:hypothetical protein
MSKSFVLDENFMEILSRLVAWVGKDDAIWNTPQLNYRNKKSIQNHSKPQ